MTTHIGGYRLGDIEAGGPTPTEASRGHDPEPGTGATGGEFPGETAAEVDDGAAVGRLLRTGERLSDGLPIVAKVFPGSDLAVATREAEIAGAVDHPHILSPIELVAGDDLVALILPWLDGGSLAELLVRRGRIDWTETLTVLIPLADALAMAHERGFVHGDISTANVMFDSSGRPMLIDFGAARAEEDCGGQVCATPAFVAPEVARGATPGPRSDLFGLGAVALACVTGRAAWFADDLRDVVIQSAAGQWPDLDDSMAPRELCTLIRRLLDPDPERRGSAAQTAIDLRDVGRPAPVELLPDLVGRGDRVVLRATAVRHDAARPPGLVAQQRDERGGLIRRRAQGRIGQALRAGRSVLGRGSVIRAVAAGGVIAGLLVVAAWVGWGLSAPESRPAVAGASVAVSAGGSDTSPAGVSEKVRPSAATPSGGAPAAGWQEILGAIDQRRAQAFTEAVPGLLDGVYVPASPLRDADVDRIRTMIRSGWHVGSADHEFESVRPLRLWMDGSVELAAIQRQPAREILGDDGSVVGLTAELGSMAVRIRLQPTSGGYRIARVAVG